MRYRGDKLEVNIRKVYLCLSSEKLYVLPWGQMSYWGATVITNLLSAIPWVGTDLVEFIFLLFISLSILAILPTIGSVNYKALRGRAPRTENEKRYALNIPFDFLSMLVGLIDGDGYISITQTPGGFIRIELILSMNMEELDMVKYIQSVLKVGRINTYPAINTVKYIISRTDLQEVVFPLLAHHGLSFLTNVRRAQFDRAMFILQNNINLFSQLPTEIPSRNSLPTTPPWSCPKATFCAGSAKGRAGLYSTSLFPKLDCWVYYCRRVIFL
jgi:hypothetical protein